MPEPEETFDMYQIEKFELSDHAKDGSLVLIKCKQPDGDEFIFSFPPEQVFDLIGLATAQATNCRKARGEDLSFVRPFRVSGLRLGIGRPTNETVLSLTFANGADLAFELPKPLLENMADALQDLLGRSNALKPPGPLN